MKPDPSTHCPHCGSQAKGTNFCTDCGKKLPGDVPPEVEATAPTGVTASKPVTEAATSEPGEPGNASSTESSDASDDPVWRRPKVILGAGIALAAVIAVGIGIAVGGSDDAPRQKAKGQDFSYQHRVEQVVLATQKRALGASAGGSETFYDGVSCQPVEPLAKDHDGLADQFFCTFDYSQVSPVSDAEAGPTIWEVNGPHAKRIEPSFDELAQQELALESEVALDRVPVDGVEAAQQFRPFLWNLVRNFSGFSEQTYSCNGPVETRAEDSSFDCEYEFQPIAADDQWLGATSGSYRVRFHSDGSVVYFGPVPASAPQPGTTSTPAATDTTTTDTSATTATFVKDCYGSACDDRSANGPDNVKQDTTPSASLYAAVGDAFAPVAVGKTYAPDAVAIGHVCQYSFGSEDLYAFAYARLPGGTNGTAAFHFFDTAGWALVLKNGQVQEAASENEADIRAKADEMDAKCTVGSWKD